MIGLWGPQNLMSKSNSAIDADFAGIFFKPIAEYLNNPDTAEIMVNAHDDIWVEDSNGLHKVPETFSQDALVSAVNSLAQYVGRPIIENVFAIDARMPDGSRVCIVLPPVSGEDPIFAIRKFKAVVSDLEFLVKRKTLTTEMVEFIEACVHLKKNMMVSGGTSSGKTTLLNLIAAKIPDHDRIVTIEDSRELQLKQDHVLSLEAKPADKYGKGEFSIRQCLKSTLRLRPDRIVVGEIRAGEAFDLIQAMNTGHGGCMGTVHANTPTDTLRRMESLALMADIDMPLVALRSMIASALDLIICPARLSDGSRRIVQIAEIGALTEKGDYQTYDIIRYVSARLNKNTRKIEGYFEFTGHIPSFYDMFEAEGLHVPIEFFRKRIMGEVPEDMVAGLREKGFEIDAKIIKPDGEIVALDKPLPALKQNPAPIQSVQTHPEEIPPEKETIIETSIPKIHKNEEISAPELKAAKLQMPVPLIIPVQESENQLPPKPPNQVPVQSHLEHNNDLHQDNFIAGQYDSDFEEAHKSKTEPETNFQNHNLNQQNIHAQPEIFEQNHNKFDENQDEQHKINIHQPEVKAEENIHSTTPHLQPEKDEYQTNTNFDDDLPQNHDYNDGQASNQLQNEETDHQITHQPELIQTSFDQQNAYSPVDDSQPYLPSAQPTQETQSLSPQNTSPPRPSILERLSRISGNYNSNTEAPIANPEIVNNSINHHQPESFESHSPQPSHDFNQHQSFQPESPQSQPVFPTQSPAPIDQELINSNNFSDNNTIQEKPLNQPAQDLFDDYQSPSKANYQFEDNEEDFNLNPPAPSNSNTQQFTPSNTPDQNRIQSQEPNLPLQPSSQNNSSAMPEEILNEPSLQSPKEQPQPEASGNSQNAVIAEILRRMRESRGN